MTVVLHQWEISPFCQKVAKALSYKGIAFEAVNYNGALAAKVQGLSKVGKVPVLDINGLRIQDSTRIARYLDEAYPDAPRLYPDNALLKAQVELWEDWSDELLYFYEVYFRVNDPVALNAAVDVAMLGRPTYERMVMKPMLKTALKAMLYFQGLGRVSSEDVEAEFHRHLARIEVTLAATGWLVGESRTIADIAVATQLSEVIRTSQRMGPIILQHPRLAKWLKAQA